MNGEPVEVETTINVNFTLEGGWTLSADADSLQTASHQSIVALENLEMSERE